MKPIEIHIEGYKIVISKEDEKAEDAVTTIKVPLRLGPQDDVFNIITTNPPTIVRDTMVGKKDKDE